MPVSRTAQRVCFAVASISLASVSMGLGCSSKDDGGIAPGPSASGSTSNTSMSGASVGGSSPMTGGSPAMQGGATSMAGSAVGGSAGTPASTGGVGGGAVGGSSTGGASAGAATGGTGGQLDAGDTMPWRPLMVTAAVGEHVHNELKAGMDTRPAKLLGKLVVDVGVNEGNYQSWLSKRGYHSMGAPCGACMAPDLADGNRTRVSACRLGEFMNMAAAVKTKLDALQTKYPEEDWGFFENKDGSVRWSDVAITGLSHGATAAAVAGHIGARMWRIVSRSGPRDNICGLPAGKCSAPISTPNYDPACPDTKVASWLDEQSKTPMDRFYGLVGMMDDQCGDIMFDMHRTKYAGAPLIFDADGVDLTKTNQFFAATQGHYDFLAGVTGVKNGAAVLNIAFAIPTEDQTPKF